MPAVVIRQRKAFRRKNGLFIYFEGKLHNLFKKETSKEIFLLFEGVSENLWFVKKMVGIFNPSGTVKVCSV